MKNRNGSRGCCVELFHDGSVDKEAIKGGIGAWSMQIRKGNLVYSAINDIEIEGGTGGGYSTW